MSCSKTEVNTEETFTVQGSLANLSYISDFSGDWGIALVDDNCYIILQNYNFLDKKV